MFSKKDKKYLILLAITIIGIFLVEFYAPQPIDWRPTYAKGDKIPYGSYILFQQLEQLFGEESIKTSNVTAYELSSSGELYDYKNIIYLQNDFSPEKLDFEALSEWVAKGNSVFVAASNFKGNLADTLKLATSYKFSFFKGQDGKDLEGLGPFSSRNTDGASSWCMGLPVLAV